MRETETTSLLSSDKTLGAQNLQNGRNQYIRAPLTRSELGNIGLVMILVTLIYFGFSIVAPNNANDSLRKNKFESKDMDHAIASTWNAKSWWRSCSDTDDDDDEGCDGGSWWPHRKWFRHRDWNVSNEDDGGNTSHYHSSSHNYEHSSSYESDENGTKRESRNYESWTFKNPNGTISHYESWTDKDGTPHFHNWTDNVETHG